VRTQGVHRLTRRGTVIHARRKVGVQRKAQRPLRRHIAISGITPQVARQGRFGSHFAAHAGKTHFRTAHIAAHRAWRHHWRAGFVAWYGPVFWPYAYSDIFDYAFWPWGYDDGFWYYAYDDFFDGVFWGEYGPPQDYAYAPPAGVSVPRAARAPRATYAGAEELCTQPGTGITAWPFADIERKVGLNAEQKQLLADVRKAADDAAATFKASCPAENAFPLTPPGRLQAMTARLQATLDAVKIVRPALEKFYASLSDEQKERFNALGPKRPAISAEASAALPPDAKACSEAKPGLATLPIERIKDVVKPTTAQQDALKQLQDATNKAVSVLQAACPQDTPLTPPGRLEAMEKRLQAMVDAANTVKPALEGFYASLSNEQKARFNRIGRELAQSNR
jgi:ABC-type transporter MlaC component